MCYLGQSKLLISAGEKAQTIPPKAIKVPPMLGGVFFFFYFPLTLLGAMLVSPARVGVKWGKEGPGKADTIANCDVPSDRAVGLKMSFSVLLHVQACSAQLLTSCSDLHTCSQKGV